MLLHPCIACQHGDHDHCMGGQAPPEGMLGGWRCPCEGECRDRRFARDFDAQMRRVDEALADLDAAIEESGD